jgi:catechol 2,3-dioxygenase
LARRSAQGQSDVIPERRIEMSEPNMEAGSALPAAATPGLVRLQVSDLDRSLEFYEGLLGMSVVARSDGVVRLGPARGAALLELRGGAVATASRRGRLGLYHFAVLLPDRARSARSTMSALAVSSSPASSANSIVRLSSSRKPSPSSR